MPSDKSNKSPQEQQSSDHNVEIITPLKVRGRSSQPDSSRPRRLTVLSLFFLLTVLAVVAGGFFFIRHLSKHPVNLTDDTGQTAQSEVDVPRTQVPDLDQTSAPQSDTVTNPAPDQRDEPKNVAREKETAEKELAEFLKLKKEIEEKGVAEWGGETYEEMISLSREADVLLMDNVFLASAEKYEQAGWKASELADRSDAVFHGLFEEGSTALDDGDSIIAREKFRTALMINPTNEQARRSLKRAENLDAVSRLIESGKNHENNNRFAFALADYQEALKADPESREAQESLNRVKERIAGEQFQELMSDGLTAYHKGNYQRARTSLLKAKSFRPGSREVQNALVLVDEAVRLDKIEKMRQKAMTAEHAEDWDQALKSYLAVLEIDPNISFAVQGKERSLEHIRVAKRITFFLQKPDAMESDQQLQNAILVVEEAERLQPKGPRLSARLDELRGLLDAARTPVKVMIESDNLTDVDVYKVGRFGRFTTRELSLRPGTYIVVGSRDGYKDVRQKIIVKAGNNTLRINVICTDKVLH